MQCRQCEACSSDKLLHGHGPRKGIALQHIAALLHQVLGLFQRFHAFGGDLQPQAVCQCPRWR